MIATIASVWALFLGIGMFVLGSSLQHSLLGLRGSSAAFSMLTIGIVMSSYFTGFLAGSAVVPRLVERVGHIRVFGALASLASAAALLYAVFVDPWTWMALRFLTGFCSFGLFVVAESWLNDRSTNATRGQTVSLYLTVVIGAMSAGPLLLNLGDPDGFVLFITASVMVSLALVPVSLASYSAPAFEQMARLGLGALYRISPLGVVGAFTNGVAMSALLGLASVYALDVGMSLGNVSIFVSAATFGGLLLLWPLGRLSDRFDRRRVLTAAALAGGTAATAAAIWGAGDPVLAIAGVGLVGGLAMPIYALAVVHTNDHVEPRQMVAASSGLLFASGLGGIAGPTVAGGAMALIGPPGFFGLFAISLLSLFAFALWRMTRRDAPPLERQGPSIVIPRTSGTAAALALADRLESEGQAPSPSRSGEPTGGPPPPHRPA